MSQLIKKHRRQLFGVAFPVIFLFVMTVVGLSVFPGWIKPTYSTPGAVCTTIGSTATDPLLLACDPCLGETCNFVSGPTSSGFECGVQPFGNLFPQCPACQCQTITTEVVGTGFFIQPQCGTVSDAYCQGIAGGDISNDCRVGLCTTNTSFDVTNPTGCDFNFNVDDDTCINCAAPTAQSVNCGNGVCEQGIGETFASCPDDCQVPGFPFDAPLPTDSPILDNACTEISVLGISFSGNFPGSETCEDGDVCTVNACDDELNQCTSTPAACNAQTADFCCPAGCTATTDVDCLTPENCQPTPSPTAIPANNLDLFGDGFMPCSLNRDAKIGSVQGMLGSLSIGIGLIALVLLRRKSKQN